MTATALGQWHLTVWGKPETKKSTNEVAFVNGQPKVFPKYQWRKWAKNATITGFDFANRPSPTARLNLRAHFYRPANRGDYIGFLQGIGDLLQERKVIHNDRQIIQSDGSRLFVDKDQPRVEVTLEELP